MDTISYTAFRDHLVVMLDKVNSIGSQGTYELSYLNNF